MIEVAPDMADAYYELADLYTRMGRMDKVREVNEKLKASGQTEDPNILFNVGADQPCSVLELAQAVARVMGVEPRIHHAPDVRGDDGIGSRCDGVVVLGDIKVEGRRQDRELGKDRVGVLCGVDGRADVDRA